MRFNFIDQIEEKTDQKEILTSKTLTLNQFLYLEDHSFNGQIIIPAVIFLEMFAQAAKSLLPDYHCNSIDFAEFKHFFILDPIINPKIYTYISVNESDGNSCHLQGEIYYNFINEKMKITRKKNIANMAITVKKNELQYDRQFLFPFFATSDLIINKDEIYPDLVGLGASFNHLDQVFQISQDKGINGRLKKIKLTGTDSNTFLLGDLFLRDSSYHLASIWGNHFVGGFNVPVAFENIKIYQKLREDREYYCMATPLSTDQQKSTYKLDIIDSHGYLVESYEKITYTYKVTIAEKDNGKMTQRKQKIQEFEKLKTNVAKHLSNFAIWNTLMVKANHRFFLELLTEDEKNLYHQYLFEKNKLEFLGARIALKLCVIKNLKQDISFLSINIKRARDGSPLLYLNDSKEDKLFFSISHKQEYIFCAVACQLNLGIDVEKITDKLKKVKSYYMSPEEENLLTNADKQNDLLLNYAKLWSSKESLVKWLKTHSLMDILRNGRLTAINDNELILKYQSKDSNFTLVARCFIYNHYVFSAIL